MGTVSTSLSVVAREIFTDLGYAVSEEPDGLRAERKWRVVQVTPMAEPGETPENGHLRCFVTWENQADAIRECLLDAKPDYDWAVIGAESPEEYEVVHPQVGPTPVS